jgi:ribosomal protein L37E
MTDVTEAAADVLTAAVVAATIEGQAVVEASQQPDAHATCRNCGAALDEHDKYCRACGQPVRLHRTLTSLGHDVLHAVFHFDGKLWRTIPELAIFPGRLTRRYIDGERRKFVSPMALYLFTVFLMYAVFSLAGARLTTPAPEPADTEELEQFDKDFAELRDDVDTSPAPATGQASRGIWARAFGELKDNPSLMTYKLKTNGYKYSWLLVPLSIPFMWLLFFWRRDVLLYDHAVFVTYSISFMMMVLIVAALAQIAGASSGAVGLVVPIVAAVHMYRQLRGAYGLSRAGAVVRLFFLLIAASIVLTIFMVLIFLIGAPA